MVYSPSMYLVASAVAVVALQMQQAAATSLESDPYSLKPPDSKEPMYSNKDVSTETCKYEYIPDQTLPDPATIPSVNVQFPGLLCNRSTPPGPISLKVGINIVLSDPTDDPDKYSYVTSESLPNLVTQGSSIVPATMTDTKTPTDCATGWDKPTATPTDNSIDSGNVLKKIHRGRRLKAYNSTQIAVLEEYFGLELIRTLANLPIEAVYSTIPWPGPYWSACQDSINVNVFPALQSLSVADKYAIVFDLDKKVLADTISKDEGIDQEFLKNRTKTPCTEQAHCTVLNNGSNCCKRKDHDSGFCFEPWWGMCNSWATASIFEPEPQCLVKYKGVTFYPIEIKALLTYVYERAQLPYVALGVRCADFKDEKDEFGRSKYVCFNDMNPGFVHIALANIMGILGKTFIVDIAPGLPVWNQPLRGYKVLEQTKFSLKKAAKTFYGLKDYPWNVNASSIVYVKTRLTWVISSNNDGPLISTGAVDQFTQGTNLTYLLEMDRYGTIIGGEWVYDSLNDHPDFMWFPTRKLHDKFVLKNKMTYENVKKLLNMSLACSATQ